MHWLKVPNENNVNNLNSIKREASSLFRNKYKGYMIANIDDLETNSKLKNIRERYSTNYSKPRCYNMS